MMKKLYIMTFVVVLMSTLIFGVCSAAPPAVKEIRIGASESLTGMYSGFATGGSFGMKAAVEDINRQGGIFVKEYNRKLPVKL
ncbi:MAG: amino acid ABC transporter substrate-binding protein, partial [Deltaproteobacteria bacterium]|nr:amino acid ABC transporter substrate-binding protein [Deltaproteobacteria bacterium]